MRCPGAATNAPVRPGRRPVLKPAAGQTILSSMLALAGKYALDAECERTALARLYRGYRRADGAPVLAKLPRGAALFAGLSRDALEDDMTLMVVRFDPGVERAEA